MDSHAFYPVGSRSPSIRSERWRYILYNNGPEELYDHATDSHEWIKLPADPAQTAQKQTQRRELCRRVGMTPPIRSASAPSAHLVAYVSTLAEDSRTTRFL